MAKLVLFNKPFDVLCQFTDKENRKTIADFLPSGEFRGFYPAGRLDRDSEGLVALVDSGQLQHRIANPKQKMSKTYWVQVEGEISKDAITQLRDGVMLKDGLTQPASAKCIPPPKIWTRTPPIRYRANDTTSWIELSIKEGKNRQVRRMTAAVGFPTLRLIRYAIGSWTLNSLRSQASEINNLILPGAYSCIDVHLPTNQYKGKTYKNKIKKHMKGESK